MKVFVTGATGYVGSRVAALLLGRGHRVTGLARTDASAGLLTGLGILPFRGSLEEAPLLQEACRHADAVIHTAFDHAADWGEAVAVDRMAHEALVEALAGSGKPLVVSNGTGIHGDTGAVEVTEHVPPRPSPRVEVEAIALRASDSGIRAASVRLPLIVYGRGGSVFVPTMIAAAQRDRVSYVIEAGTNRISVVHVDDAAELYVAILEHRSARGVFHAASDAEVTLRSIADAISRMLNVPTRSVSREAARAVWHPTWAQLLALTNRVRGQRSRDELGWRPRQPASLTEDIEHGSYRNASALS